MQALIRTIIFFFSIQAWFYVDRQSGNKAMWITEHASLRGTLESPRRQIREESQQCRMRKWNAMHVNAVSLSWVWTLELRRNLLSRIKTSLCLILLFKGRKGTDIRMDISQTDKSRQPQMLLYFVALLSIKIISCVIITRCILEKCKGTRASLYILVMLPWLIIY